MIDQKPQAPHAPTDVPQAASIRFHICEAGALHLQLLGRDGAPIAVAHLTEPEGIALVCAIEERFMERASAHQPGVNVGHA